MKTLLIDNYDSFTYNLFQLLAEANGDEPIVVRNDEATWEELRELRVRQRRRSRPAPDGPTARRTSASARTAIRAGRRAAARRLPRPPGARLDTARKVVHAPEAMHGRVSAVLHEDSPLFAGIPREFQAVRYHSLCVEQPLPDELEPIAWTSDGVLMAVAHTDAAAVGRAVPPRVDLHRARPRRCSAELPRPDGRALAAGRGGGVARLGGGAPAARRDGRRRRAGAAGQAARPARTTPSAPSSTSTARADDAFWLDSSRLDERARFSFMGDAGGPLRPIDHLRRRRAASCGSTRRRARQRVEESIFDYLEPRDAPPAPPSPTTFRSTSTAASSATSATS